MSNGDKLVVTWLIGTALIVWIAIYYYFKGKDK